MDLTHDPEDEDAFAAISTQLVEMFERSPGGKDLGWVADQLLQFKHGYLDGDLGRWTAADLSEVLFELYPRKVVLEPGDEAEVLAGTAAFLRFLDSEPGRLPRPGPVGRAGRAQAIARFHGEAGLARAIEVVARPHPASVLAGQRRHDMHVAVGMPHRHPPHRPLVTARRQADAVPVLAAMSAHWASVSTGSSFAAAIARWCTGRACFHWSRSRPAASSGAFSVSASRPSSRPPRAVVGGSSPSAPSQAAISRGAVCGALRPSSPARPSRNR